MTRERGDGRRLPGGTASSEVAAGDAGRPGLLPAWILPFPASYGKPTGKEARRPPFPIPVR